MPMQINIDSNQIAITDKNIKFKKQLIAVYIFGITLIMALAFLYNTNKNTTIVAISLVIFHLVYLLIILIKSFSDVTIIDKGENTIRLKQSNKIKFFQPGEFKKITVRQVNNKGNSFYMALMICTNGEYSLDINEPFKDDLIKTCTSISQDLEIPIEISSKEMGVFEFYRFKNR